MNKNVDVKYFYALLEKGKQIQLDPLPDGITMYGVDAKVLRDKNIVNVNDFFERYPFSNRRKQIVLYAQPSGNPQKIFVQSHEDAKQPAQEVSKTTTHKKNTTNKMKPTQQLQKSLESAQNEADQLKTLVSEKDGQIALLNERVNTLQRELHSHDLQTEQRVRNIEQSMQEQVYSLRSQMDQQHSTHEIALAQKQNEMDRLHSEREAMVQEARNEGYELGRNEGIAMADEQLNDDMKQRDLYQISHPAVRTLKQEYATLSDELKRTKRKLRKFRSKANSRSIALADTFAQYQPLLMDAVLPVIVPPLVNKTLTFLGLEPLSQTRIDELNAQGEQVRQNEKLKRMLAEYERGRITREEFANETQFDPDTLYVDATGIVRQRTAPNIIKPVQPPQTAQAPMQAMYGNLDDDDDDDDDEDDEDENDTTTNAEEGDDDNG
jgi:hypothetical protein